MSVRSALGFTAEGSTSLDGIWDFYPGDHDRARLDEVEAESIRVPGLWEAQGHLDLDGVAWYRRRFELDEVGGYWSLRFGAVMDLSDVYLNGVLLGSHDNPFIPFELDASGVLVRGENVLEVRVDDPPLASPEHQRLVHGKQGWGNKHFPSRPSLYMTYGGIWQPVTLQRHGPVVVRDVFVNGDPDRLVVSADVEHRGREPAHARLRIEAIGLGDELDAELEPGERRTLHAELGPTDAAHWRPESPVLHEATASVLADGAPSDTCIVRYGLRTVRIDGDRLVIDGTPYRMKSALVQGFRAEELYAEGSREAILEEVLAAKEMGFNTLRLHIKAFDPAYLDVCDEEGMVLHCDVPVAEPIAYAEMGDADSLLVRRSVAAAHAQVRRDRNHPSIVLWSAMNEICLRRKRLRRSAPYERFARTLAAAVAEVDETRPVIENDWIEPDAAHVFTSPILTAHWYGRLHTGYLGRIEAKSARWAGSGRPLFVTEYGDWGLPDMPELPNPPFWDFREAYAAGLAEALWPGDVESFVRESQRYQGLSDRFQTEIFRRHDHIGGYCVTELTDVPHELNGLLDLHRHPKPGAVAEMARANQVVLPMLAVESFTVATGSHVRWPVHVANDGDALDGVQLRVGFRGSGPEGKALLEIGELAAHRAVAVGAIELTAPAPGTYELALRLSARGHAVAANEYPLHVLPRVEPPGPVRLVGGGASEEALRAVDADIGAAGPLVVAERALDEAAGAELGRELGAGRSVVVLAQEPAAGAHYPVPTEIRTVKTKWGSPVVHFTNDDEALSALPSRSVLITEDATIYARRAVVGIDGRVFPDNPVVAAYKPAPRAMTGTILGAHAVGPGRLIFCQYRLSRPAARGDAAAQLLLTDLVRWAGR